MGLSWNTSLTKCTFFRYSMSKQHTINYFITITYIYIYIYKISNSCLETFSPLFPFLEAWLALFHIPPSSLTSFSQPMLPVYQSFLRLVLFGMLFQKTRVINHRLEREALSGILENILSHFPIYLAFTISNLFLAYRKNSNFKTISAYSITCNSFGNSKLMSSICSERILGNTFIALSFMCPVAVTFFCPFCKNTAGV